MSSRYDDNWDSYEERPTRRKGPNWKKAFAITLSIVLALVVAGGAAVLYFGNSLINLTNYISDDEQKLFTQEEVDAKIAEEEAADAAAAAGSNTAAAGDTAEADNTGKAKTADGEDDVEEIVLEKETEKETAAHKGTALSQDELAKLQSSMSEASSADTMKDENVFNIVLTGVDRRDKSWNGNSDSMMLVSINFNAKRVSIISLMRDTYVNIPDVGYAKLNNAYARGGGSLMCQTISDNYNIDVSNYAAVDFEDMIDIVDALGGVELEWTDKEVEIANGYMYDMCNTLGLNGSDYYLPGGGVYLCSGVQAVAYARNRYVGNSDYARTERQRYVISQIIKKIETLDAGSLASFVTAVLPLISHNLELSDIWDLVSKAPEVMSYDFVMDRVPYDGMYDVIYVDSQDMLVPWWGETIEIMHNTIYGDGSVSSNSDNNQEDRTVNNNTTNDEFQYDIVEGNGLDSSLLASNDASNGE